MEHHLDAYCMNLRSERQVSPHTLEAYRRDLGKVLAFCQKAGLSSWTNLDIQHLRSFTARQHQQGQSSRSLARMLSAVRGFYKYLNREGICQHDPANGLSPPKGERRLPKTLDTDRAAQLLDGAVEEDFLAQRDQAILELLYSSGLRLSELTGLNLDQLDLRAGWCKCLGKGSKTRVLPVGSKARKALESWLPLRALTNPQDDAVFVSQHGTCGAEPGQGRRRARAWAEPAPAHAASFICQPSAGVIARPARGAGAAWPRRYQNHADLHASGLSAPGDGL